MNRTLYAMALFAALGITEVAHAQVNSTSPPAKPSAAEPIKQIPIRHCRTTMAPDAEWECRRAAARRRPPLRRWVRRQILPRLVDERGGRGVICAARQHEQQIESTWPHWTLAITRVAGPPPHSRRLTSSSARLSAAVSLGSGRRVTTFRRGVGQTPSTSMCHGLQARTRGN